ncbi:hypothetical protein C7E18_20550 [Stenotrophomonas maltophilia]|nr:hypothetical protein C7E18_20550 [Stenotrophomonas maltophilia]
MSSPVQTSMLDAIDAATPAQPVAVAAPAVEAKPVAVEAAPVAEVTQAIEAKAACSSMLYSRSRSSTPVCDGLPCRPQSWAISSLSLA